jgi:ATP-dependent DNA helicase RecG
MDPKALEPLQAELPHVDVPSAEARKAALRRMLGKLKRAGLELPPELDSLAAPEPTAPARQPPSAPARREPVASASRPQAPEPASPAARPAPARAAPPLELSAQHERPRVSGPATSRAAGGKRPRKKAVGLTESKGEAKLLSIAPRTGPLATPLKLAGWKLSPRLVGTLNKKGVQKVGDILFLLPRCYEDRRSLSTISRLVDGERGIFVGEVRAVQESRPKGRPIFKAIVGDRTGTIALTFFQSGPWLKARFPVGKRLVISGEVRVSNLGWEISHPETEPADDLDSSKVHFNRIVPVYPGFERGEQRAFRDLTFKVAERFAAYLEDPLPPALRQRLNLMELPQALRAIHFPPDDADLEKLDRHLSDAHRRLAFDELFFLQLGLSLKRQGVKVEPGISFNVADARLATAKSALPVSLTGAQARVIDELRGDMARPQPMSRLIQGDVGSGKTAVAMVAATLAMQDGYQVAVMAPTEILAEQHHRTMRKLLEPLGYPVGLVTASGTPKHKREVRDAVAQGRIRLAVGTHALIQEGVEFERLGLVVIDEQHRFGVLQRHLLRTKGLSPDVLVMTATPIPRTLAMTLYGDLDVSVIDELPPGRTPISTKVFYEKQRERVYQAVADELARGHQAYVVYPLVEESEKVDLADATQGLEKLRAIFKDHQVGLLHGRMKQEEKDAVMADFRDKRIHVLVCTTVVEVGVDVPNASVMVIEHAERFGLSQLHQLRGRVGRGAAKSHCLLLAGYAKSAEAADRLAVMEQSSDGFVIAEKDLELRGPGEFLGTRQSGMPELAVANLTRDGALLGVAQREARAILERDPQLREPENLRLVRALEERWEGRLALAGVG